MSTDSESTDGAGSTDVAGSAAAACITMDVTYEGTWAA